MRVAQAGGSPFGFALRKIVATARHAMRHEYWGTLTECMGAPILGILTEKAVSVSELFSETIIEKVDVIAAELHG